MHQRRVPASCCSDMFSVESRAGRLLTRVESKVLQREHESNPIDILFNAHLAVHFERIWTSPPADKLDDGVWAVGGTKSTSKGPRPMRTECH